LKLLQKRIGKVLEHIGKGNSFLNRTLVAQRLRERSDKWDYMKVKNFCTAKETVTRLMRQPTKWEKIFASYLSDKGLTTRIFR
jgi:hypothetical protein